MEIWNLLIIRMNVEPTLIAQSHPTTIENMNSPDKRDAVVKNIAISKLQDQSLKISNLQRMVPAKLQPISKKLANQALKGSRSNVSTNES